jgi:hypothetical protein
MWEKNRGPFNSFEVNNILFVEISKGVIYCMDHGINKKGWVENVVVEIL